MSGARPRPTGRWSVRVALRTLAGFSIGCLARLWLATLRVRVDTHPGLVEVRERPWVLAFFHGTQWPLLAWRRRGMTLVLVSHSADGDLQAAALSVLGFTVVRGSSSRGGLRGLATLARPLRERRWDAAFAVDGPRGPRGLAKGGALTAARVAGAVVVPMGSSVAKPLTLRRSWDAFTLALPFGRVSVTLGRPIEPTRANEDANLALSREIEAANALAKAIVRSEGVVRGGTPRRRK